MQMKHGFTSEQYPSCVEILACRNKSVHPVLLLLSRFVSYNNNSSTSYYLYVLQLNRTLLVLYIFRRVNWTNR